MASAAGSLSRMSGLENLSKASASAPERPKNDYKTPDLAIQQHDFFIRKPFFCLSLNFLNIMLKIRLRFS